MIIVALLGEPKGWRKLQAMAQRERDPQKLAHIIDQMNRLFDRHEKMAADGNADEPMSKSRTPDCTLELDVQTWQLET